MLLFDASATPAAPNPTQTITVFLTAMVALSVAAERVTETAKQWLGSYLNKIPTNYYAAIVQTFAILAGMLVTALSGQYPIPVPQSLTPTLTAFDFSDGRNWLYWLVTGILVSGGSAFWNHLLDILQSTKVQKETAAPPPANGAGK
jgi:drug/metabolite transporter (DMT)-like permease